MARLIVKPYEERTRWRNLIRRIRKALDVTQEQLAALLHVSYTTVNRWEAGHGLPRRALRRVVYRLAKSKGVAL